MRPSYEKLIPSPGESFRCFERSALESPVKWHRHPEIELTYIQQGSGSRIVGDHIGSYGDHDLVLSGSQLPHTWTSDEFRGQPYDRHAAIVLQFHPEFLGPEFFACGEMVAISNMLQRAECGLWFPPETARVAGRKMQDLITAIGAARLIGLLSILDFLSQCTTAKILGSAGYRLHNSGSPGSEMETRIQKICDYIENHLTDPELSHRQLAELANMNASAFSRFFKQSTGRTVSAYVNELRIGLACRLLNDTDAAILSICYQAGFANLSNFNRRFKQLRGMTPREYRTQFRSLA